MGPTVSLGTNLYVGKKMGPTVSQGKKYQKAGPTVQLGKKYQGGRSRCATREELERRQFPLYH